MVAPTLQAGREEEGEEEVEEKKTQAIPDLIGQVEVVLK
jgi:hypothetical protein